MKVSMSFIFTTLHEGSNVLPIIINILYCKLPYASIQSMSLILIVARNFSKSISNVLSLIRALSLKTIHFVWEVTESLFFTIWFLTFLNIDSICKNCFDNRISLYLDSETYWIIFSTVASKEDFVTIIKLQSPPTLHSGKQLRNISY